MRAIALALAATAMLGAAALEAKPRLTPEQRLEKLIEGREAGKPTSCIPNYSTSDLEVLDGVGLVYRNGTTLYVNRTVDPKDVDSDDILVVHTFGGQLCRHDMVRTLDRTGGFMTGFIQLADFVPYRRIQTAAR